MVRRRRRRRPGAVPEPLRAGPPDLFEDRLLDFVGAYDRPGGQFLTLTGRGPDPGDPGRVVPRSFAFGVRLPDVDASHPEIPRLLAARVLARDWDRARLGAAPFADPVGMEILRRSAGLRFPWLPFDLEDAPPAEGTRRLADAAEAVAARAARGGLPEMRGAGDLPAAESRLLWSLLHDPLSSEAVEDLLGRREGGPAAVAAGGKLFLRRGSGWTDSGVERREGPERTALPPPARTWAAASEAFWNGAAETPALAPFLALGPDVLFEWNGLLFRVTPP